MPLPGDPVVGSSIEDAGPVGKVGLLGVGDFPGLRPSMQVDEGDKVKPGQVLWVDKKNPALVGIAPAGGTVSAIYRGARRSLLSVAIDLDEKSEPVKIAALRKGGAEKIRNKLVDSGLWSLLRQRPYDKVPGADATPAAILVTALDTRPLAAEPAPLLRQCAEDFVYGLQMLAELTAGPVLVCHAASEEVPLPKAGRIRPVAVRGPHPAGLPGILLHHLYPPTTERPVWILDWQGVLAISRLLRRGELPTHRYVSLGGEGFARPRLVRCRIGSCVSQLCDKELKAGNWRLISGSPLHGHRAEGAEDFLGLHHGQIAALPEVYETVFLNWLRPGLARHSRLPVFASSLLGGTVSINTLRNGCERGLVPVEVYQESMPLQLPVVHLLKALLVGDTEQAQRLGCLEFGPEDLSVCTYVCPSKYDYGAVLRAVLDRIEREG